MVSPLPSLRYPEERRLATVLFADVRGFTALAERMDFELISDLIKDVWISLDILIEAHGGYIDKHIGDAVMAVWGAPYAGENDAERAVSAALSLQEAVKEYAKTSMKPGASELSIRVGINSGYVLSGYVGLRNEYTVMGDAVNIANRLEQISEPGTVVISESTFRLVRGMIQVRRLATPIQLRGKTQAIQAYLVDRLMPQPSRLRYNSADSLMTIMVARENEMERLNSLYEEAMRAEVPMLVMVLGETGIGKSRLLMEFTSQLEVSEQGVNLMSVRALAQTAQIPFFLWKSLWYLRFGLQDNEPMETLREKFTREIQRLWGWQLGPTSSVEAAHLIGSLIGLSWPDSPYLAAYENDSPGRLKRAFELTRELIRRISSFRSTVLMFDDLQWGDSSSLDLLAYLFQPAEDPLPLLVLTGARSEFARKYSRWMNLASILELEPLPVNSEIVAEAYPDLKDFPEEVLLELAVRSDGNPYFMEEMAKSLVKSGMHLANLAPDELLAQVRAITPESLRVLLQARLDRLSHESRSVAQLASVVGRVFWVGAVIAAARVAEGMGTGPLVAVPDAVIERLIQDALRQLVRAELAFPKANVAYSEEQEFIFKNSLLREVAYGLIPVKNRFRYHLAVALWLADHENVDFKIMAAEHFELGGALAEAAKHYEAAAEFALMRGAAVNAEELLAKARELRETVFQKAGTAPLPKAGP